MPLARLALSFFILILMCLETANASDLLDKGIKPGKKAPVQISLPDQSGLIKSFEDLTGEKGLILLMNRSSSWCGHCINQMVAWNTEIKRFENIGYKIAALTYDDVAQQRRFAREQGIKYPVLSDKGSQVIQAFGLLNEQYKTDSPYYGIPHPAIYVISRDGLITHRFAEASHRIRPDIELIFQNLISDGLPLPTD